MKTWLTRGSFALLGLLAVAVAVLMAMGKRSGAGEMNGSIEIARPVPVVKAWLTEPDRLKQWVSWLVEVRKVSPTREVWVMEDRNNGNQKMEMFVDALEDTPTLLRANVWAAGSFHGVSQWRLVDLGNNRTRLEQTASFVYDEWFARLLEPLITPAAQKKSDEDLARLKQQIEAAPAAIPLGQ